MSAVSLHDLDPTDERRSATASRWGGSLLVVLGAHAALGLGMVSWRVAMEEPTAPPAAVMLDLEPLPEVAPPEPAPTLESVVPETDPPPEPVIEPQVEPEPIPEVKPDPPPPVPAEVALPEPPKPTPKPDPKPKPKEPPKPRAEPPRPRAEAKPAPQAVPAAAAPSAPVAAPTQAPPTPRASNAMPSWQGLLIGHLERYKRYPRAATVRRQEGVPRVHITIDRQGRVLAVRLEKSSGFDSLDEESVALVERASPLPAPPPELAQDRMEMVVPVQFFLR